MKRTLVAAMLAAVVLLVPKGAAAIPFTSAAGLDGLGSFSGSLVYDNVLFKLAISLINTSPAANTGFITGLAFNNPGNRITNVTLTSTDADFGLIGGAGAADFMNDISVAPYGSADVGAALGTAWLGTGGSPNQGIGVGSSATFTFAFTGAGLGTLTENSFVNTLAAGSSDSSNWLLVRFRGFTDGGSDKVGADLDPVAPSPVPEPATFLLFGAGAIVLAARSLRTRK